MLPILLLVSACSSGSKQAVSVEPVSTPPPSQKDVQKQQRIRKQCQMYEKTINDLTDEANRLQRKFAIIDLADSGSWPRSQLLMSQYTFAATTQSNYLALGAMKGCEFPNVNLPQQITD